MLIEQNVFGFYEVGEKSFMDIKNYCLSSFARDLKEALTSSNEKIRMFWVEEGSTANYKIFRDYFGSKIKYNSKNIVFEETITNNPESPWSVRQVCMDTYGLEYIPETVDHSAYFRYRKDELRRSYGDACECYVGEPLPDAEEKLRNFYEAFGKGEFPFITITIIRLGNKDHFFYTIHR